MKVFGVGMAARLSISEVTILLVDNWDDMTLVRSVNCLRTEIFMPSEFRII
jgi:hypothetical protein